MPTTIACFHCGISAAVDLGEAPMKIEYDHEEWERKCAVCDAGGILLCPNMRSIGDRALQQLHALWRQ